MKQVYFFKNHIDGTTGASKAIVDIMNELFRKGWKVKLIITKGRPLPFFPLDQGVEIIKWQVKLHPILSPIPWLSGRLVVCKLRKYLVENDIDTIVGFGMNLPLIKAGLETPTKIIISERSNFQNIDENPKTLAIRKKWYPQVAAITSNSRSTTEDLRKLTQLGKIYYTPNPFSLPEAVTELPTGMEEPKYVLAIGRFVYRKAYDVLLKAIREIKSDMDGWELRIIGDGPGEEDLRRMTAEFGLESKVKFLGTLPDPAPHLRAASMFVLPSRFEGVSNAMLDAMKFGLPIVISDVPGSLEYIEHEQNGLVFPIDDVGQLALQLRRMILDGDLRDRLGKAALQRARKAADEHSIEKWEQVLLKVLNENQKP